MGLVSIPDLKHGGFYFLSPPDQCQRIPDTASQDVVADGGTELGFDSEGVPSDSSETLLSAPGSVSFSSGDQVTVEPETGYVSTGS